MTSLAPIRWTLDTITAEALDALYASLEEARTDLDRYEEVQGEMNERAIDLTRAVARVRALHRRNENTGDCEHCSARDYPGYSVPHPCDTVRALQSAATEATELETTARVFAGLHRSAEQDITRVIALYERWVREGAPPLGVPIARWWDRRLVELHHAILPPTTTTPGPCPSCRRADQAGLAPNEQHAECITQEQT